MSKYQRVELDTRKEAERLVDRGYRGYSNKFRNIARIDRNDWKEVLAASHPRGMSWVEGLGLWHASEQYRWGHSQDRLEDVDPEVYREIKRLIKNRSLEEWRTHGYGWEVE